MQTSAAVKVIQRQRELSGMRWDADAIWYYIFSSIGYMHRHGIEQTDAKVAVWVMAVRRASTLKASSQVHGCLLVGSQHRGSCSNGAPMGWQQRSYALEDTYWGAWNKHLGSMIWCCFHCRTHVSCAFTIMGEQAC